MLPPPVWWYVVIDDIYLSTYLVTFVGNLMLQLFSFISSNKDDEEVGKMKRNMLLILKLGTPKNGEQYYESASRRSCCTQNSRGRWVAFFSWNSSLVVWRGLLKSVIDLDQKVASDTWADHNDCIVISTLIRNLDGPSFDAQLHSFTKGSRDLSSWGN